MSVGEQDSEHALCAAVVGIVEVRAAAVVLMTTGGRVVGNVCVSDLITKAVEELQYIAGEGPAVDACHTGRPVLVPDLGHAGPVSGRGRSRRVCVPPSGSRC